MAARRNIVVVGASAGGVEAVSRLLGSLPAELPAAVFVVVHVAEEPRSRLAELLAARCRLPVHAALHGERIEPGRVYVAPSDNHMIISDGHVHVVRGPREGGHRPAIDPLFRTAARWFGERVVGVVLSGTSDCGTTGLRAIVARRGVALVQSPEEAAWRDMPDSALLHVEGAVALPVAALGERIVELVHETVETSPPELPPAERAAAALTAFGVTCPTCHGAMIEQGAPDFPEYRCHVGHRFSLGELVRTQADEVEEALWAAVRALKESQLLAEKAAGHAVGDLAARFQDKARDMRLNADLIVSMLLRGELLTELDADAPGAAPGVEPRLSRR